MLGLSRSELGIVLFILVLIVASSRLPRIGETLGSYFYRRGESQKGGRKGGRRNAKNTGS
jgi:Sec-independent protein translocase protein TatA